MLLPPGSMGLSVDSYFMLVMLLSVTFLEIIQMILLLWQVSLECRIEYDFGMSKSSPLWLRWMR